MDEPSWSRNIPPIGVSIAALVVRCVIAALLVWPAVSAIKYAWERPLFGPDHAETETFRRARDLIKEGRRMDALRLLGLTDKDMYGGEGSLFWELAAAQAALPQQ